MKIKFAAAVVIAAGLTAVPSLAAASTHPAVITSRHPAVIISQPAAGHLPPDGRATRNSSGIPIYYSPNWAGYVARKSSSSQTFRYVKSMFQVPSVNCATTSEAFSYQWVGLDGWTDTSVEQGGVAGYCVSGSPEYFAWAEAYPQNVEVLPVTVSPGDAITASVYYDSGTRQYQVTVDDVTTNQSSTVDLACGQSNCHRSSAEAISEGYVATPYQGLADFGRENFENTQVTDGSGHHAGLTGSHWDTNEIINIGTESGAAVDGPGPLQGGTAFTNTWLGEN